MRVALGGSTLGSKPVLVIQRARGAVLVGSTVERIAIYPAVLGRIDRALNLAEFAGIRLMRIEFLLSPHAISLAGRQRGPQSEKAVPRPREADRHAGQTAKKRCGWDLETDVQTRRCGGGNRHGSGWQPASESSVGGLPGLREPVAEGIVPRVDRLERTIPGRPPGAIKDELPADAFGLADTR